MYLIIAHHNARVVPRTSPIMCSEDENNVLETVRRSLVIPGVHNVVVYKMVLDKEYSNDDALHARNMVMVSWKELNGKVVEKFYNDFKKFEAQPSKD